MKTDQSNLQQLESFFDLNVERLAVLDAFCTEMILR